MSESLVQRLRSHVERRGGPAKDESGKPIGTAWPMMLEAADEIERLREALRLARNDLKSAIAEIDRELSFMPPQPHPADHQSDASEPTTRMVPKPSVSEQDRLEMIRQMLPGAKA